MVRCVSETDQRRSVVQAASSTAGSGIIYVRTRAAAEEYAAALVDEGLHATAYHAGLGKRVRDEAYRSFMAGEVDVMVATSAFGMGVDKADIAFVLHAHAPESPDSYYQEVGRAGRNGEPAVAILFYRPEDRSRMRFFTAGMPDPDDVVAVTTVLEGRELDGLPRDELAADLAMSPRKLGRILNLMAEGVGDDHEGQTPVQRVLARAGAHRSMQKSRIDMMRTYAETTKCRRESCWATSASRGHAPAKTVTTVDPASRGWSVTLPGRSASRTECGTPGR